MKTLFGVTLGLIFLCSVHSVVGAPNTVSQPAQASQATLPASTAYAVVAKDAHSSVWQWETYATGPDGEVVTNLHGYTEVATGLHYQQNGQWLDTKEEIDLQPNGTASATQGQHQAYFPGDIYSGQIELVTPDGLHLKSRPLGLSYDDGTNTVLIAALTNATGQVLGANQVIYTNAFSGLTADLIYTYTKGGFEQDIVLRQQPPTPESLGLNADSSRLQILTEFFTPPQPEIQSRDIPPQAGLSLNDQSLGFGQMQMVPGRAFLLGAQAKDAGAMVAKQWVVLEGRQFLVEAVPVNAIVEGLAALPLTAMLSHPSHTAAKHLVLPPQRQVKNTTKALRMAKASLPVSGFVLDYQTVNSSLTNYTFQGDTTYYISGAVNLYGTNNILEGGAVLKYATNSSAGITIVSGLNCQTVPYRPAILTAVDDNSVGQTITNSTGHPTNYYGDFSLSFYFYGDGVVNLHDIRFCYQNVPLQLGACEIDNAQFINCYCVAESSLVYCTLKNVLVQGGTTVLYCGWGTLWGENVTIHQLNSLTTGSPVAAYLTNCLVVAVANTTNLASLSGASNVFLSSDAGIFQTVGAGANYLATSSPYCNVGTTNIDPVLLAQLCQKTTYPPLLLVNQTITNTTVLSPVIQRDTDTPDLGYHYDPIDYLVSNVTVSATVTLTNGVALGLMGSPWSLTIQNSGNLISQGTPLDLDHLAHYANVQEQSVSLGSGVLATGGGGVYTMQFRFTDISMLAGGDTATFEVVHGEGGNVSFRDCLFHGCNFIEAVTFNSYNVTCTNNVFDRCIWDTGSANGVFAAFYNNLFHGGSCLFNSTNAATPWYVQDNLFDQANLNGSAVGTNYIISSYNGFTLGTTNYLGGTNNKTNLAADYQAGPLGNYYYPASGTNLATLINAGSTNASLLGLYHYTVTTNEVVDGNNIVSIGYHYIAVDANGNPLDSNGDGIPDYLEDANGNGLVDSGEIGWNITGDLGLQVIITRPRNGSILP